jgi:hypothetical protein
MEAEKWRRGGLVTYHGLREWDRPDGNGKFRMHIVTPPGGDLDDPAGVFGIWPTAVLDRLLLKVGKGETIVLRYDGKGPHPSIRDKEQHNWTVARAENAPDVKRSAADVEPVPAPGAALPSAFNLPK